MNISPASPEDIEVVMQLYKGLHQYNTMLDAHFSLARGWEKMFRDYFKKSVIDPDALWLLLRDQGEVGGLLIAEVHTDSEMFRQRLWVELQALFILPKFRRKHNAGRLLRLLYSWSKDKDIDDIRLFVTLNNTHAQMLYLSEGFEPSQIIMRKQL